MVHYASSEKKHVTRNLECCTMDLFVHNKDKVSMDLPSLGSKVTLLSGTHTAN